MTVKIPYKVCVDLYYIMYVKTSILGQNKVIQLFLTKIKLYEYLWIKQLTLDSSNKLKVA